MNLRPGQLQRALEVADRLLVGEVTEGVLARAGVIVDGPRPVARQSPMVGQHGVVTLEFALHCRLIPAGDAAM